MNRVHHSAICARDIQASVRFWRDGLGFDVIMDHEFEGDWPGLFGAGSTTLRSIFLGDPARADSGIVELVDFGTHRDAAPPVDEPAVGFFLLSILTDLDAALARLSALGLGGVVRQIEAYGVRMAVVRDPNGVLVELLDHREEDGDE